MNKKKVSILLTIGMFMIAGSIAAQDWAQLSKYAKANQKLEEKEIGEKRVVFLGNSITEGWIEQDSAYFKQNGYINRGISGQTTPQMLVRFRSDVIDVQADVVVILAGINDIAQNTGPIEISAIFGNIRSMVELAHANKIKVVMCTVLPAIDFYWRPGLHPADKIIELNRLLKKFAIDNSIPLVDYYTPMVNERKGLKEEYSGDGVHPNLAGYKIMEPLVDEKINKALSGF